MNLCAEVIPSPLTVPSYSFILDKRLSFNFLMEQKDPGLICLFIYILQDDVNLLCGFCKWSLCV
jgi:hypothetical protein